MMTALVAASLVLGQTARTATKETLPNGAMVFVQRIEGSGKFSVALSCGSRGEPETPEAHGLRHLLEHFVAKGPQQDVDRVVEGAGMALLAETTRDNVTFSITGPKQSVALGTTVLIQLLSSFAVSDEALQREVGIIKQELALRRWDLSLVSDGWLKAYGDRALDPFGDPAAMDKVTPEMLKAAFQRLANPKSVCLAIVGDIDPGTVLAQAREALKVLVASDEPFWQRKEAIDPVMVGTSDGEAVCIPVSSFSESATLASLGAAFGLQNWLPGCSVVYTPSARPSLVTVALRTGQGWRSAALRLQGREPLVAQAGMLQLKAWLKESATDPAKLAKLAAAILPLRPGFDPSKLESMADGVRTEMILGEVRGVLAVAGGRP